MSTPTVIDLLRHGEPVGGRRYRGWIDDPLSERGWAQMWHAVSGETPWEHVVSSPLARCQAFAAALADQLGLPLTIEPRVAEIRFGVWEGMTGEELRTCDPDRLRRFYHDPLGERPEGAEPAAEFVARVSQVLDELTAAHHGRHILVVTHAGVIRAAIAHALAAPPERLFRAHVDNAAFTRLQATAERPLSLIFHGRTPL
jgi:alpha-ribazole phosphatase/probable phosphoglycerate mutase